VIIGLKQSKSHSLTLRPNCHQQNRHCKSFRAKQNENCEFGQFPGPNSFPGVRTAVPNFRRTSAKIKRNGTGAVERSASGCFATSCDRRRLALSPDEISFSARSRVLRSGVSIIIYPSAQHTNTERGNSTIRLPTGSSDAQSIN
jgi:hypothetical protein